MSNTRRASAPGPLRQERFASSVAHERGLLGNLVAQRCAQLDDPAERELLWWLQHQSHQPGGLKAFVESMLDQLPQTEWDRAREKLPGLITRLCLDPEFTSGALAILKNVKAVRARQAFNQLAQTEILQRTCNALDYALQSSGIVVIEGQERIGKTVATRAWCEQHAGLARYVQAPSSTDEASFFRVIAEALGTPSGIRMKMGPTRDRIERTLQQSRLMLVFDEGHYLWTQNNRRDQMPKRICWIMTALTNLEIPAAIIATPQFSVCRERMEKRTHWRSGQFLGRIAHYEHLPAELSREELVRIAKAHSPFDDQALNEALAIAAELDRRGAASIEFIIQRARFEAKQAGRQKLTVKDLVRVIQGEALPGEAPLEAQQSQSKRAPRRRSDATRGTRPVKPVLSTRGTRAKAGKGPELAVAG